MTVSTGNTMGAVIDALKHAKQLRNTGKTLCWATREGWHGKNMYILLQNPDKHSQNTLPYIYLQTPENDVVPWLASQTDILAEDWIIYTPDSGEMGNIESETQMMLDDAHIVPAA